ncbi:MAG TPA: hypothetical protein VMJ10_21785 [Kofleriaceae bacterium]|nr:hypothetical protein [Kofleriaceae bacterium]
MKSPNDTGTETGRNPNDANDGGTEPFAPNEDWIQQFKTQCNQSLITGLNNYARTRMLGVAYAGRKVDDYYARELVLDAIGDTWMGVVRWDPSRFPLKHHLLRVIDGHSDKHAKHAIAHPHEAIGDDCKESRAAERAASEQVAEPEIAAKRVYASEMLAKIRELAAGDKDVLRILDAYDAGATTKEDVLALAKMKDRTYHNAYGRLRRIIRNLTDQRLAPKAKA